MPQVFLNIATLLQAMVKFSLTFAPHTCFYSPFPFHLHPYAFLGPKGACQLCPLEDLRRGCRHRLASAGYGGNGGTSPPAVVAFFCVLGVSYQAEVPDLLRESLAFHTGGISGIRWE